MEFIETKRVDPVWWDAWNQLVNPLVRIGKFDSPESELAMRLQDLARQGCPVGSILSWRPNLQEAQRLRWAGCQMEWALDPQNDPPVRAACKAALLKQLEGSDQIWKDLTTLANLYLLHYWRQHDRRAITDWSHPKGRLPGHRLTTEIDQGQNVMRAQEIAHRSLAGYYPTHTLFSIYIDESFGDGELRDEAVIAGVVWAGKQVLEEVLPSIPSHLWTIDDPKQTNCKLALNRVVECNKCLPIVMKLRKPDLNAGADRKDLIQCFLKILMGWALPRTASVEVFIEQHGGDKAGEVPTDYYKGVFSSAAWQSSKRYKQWKLTRVNTVAKAAEGYVGYADLLAYVGAMPNSDLAKWFGCEKLPGFLSIPFESLKLLERIEESDSVRDPEAILDCFQALTGSGLENAVFPNLGKKLQEPAAQHRLLDALEERFKAKDRNLSRLGRQFRAIKKYVLPDDLPKDATFRLRLLWTVLQLQDANHAGDTNRGRDVARAYLELRDEAFSKDSRLVAHVDCNLAIHYCDQLDFFAAERVLLNLRQDPAFNSYDPLQKAVIESSLGQVSSMQGYTKADWHFANALALLEKADLSEERRRHEVTQTATYRAINAIDDNSKNATSMVESVLGSTLVNAAAQFGSSNNRPFEHYLLLRCLYFCRFDERRAALDEYFKSYAQESSWGSHHPWEFIEMYRGLLQVERKNKMSAHFFSRAVDLVSEGSGIASLIRAMLSTVAWCCFDDNTFEKSAREALDSATRELNSREATQAIKTLRAICTAPKITRVNEALTALPFNYH